jgi:hypothetical protein
LFASVRARPQSGPRAVLIAAGDEKGTRRNLELTLARYSNSNAENLS